MKYFFFAVLILIQISCSQMYTSGGKLNPVEIPSGKGCYVVCLTSSHYNIVGIPIIEYNGSNFNDPNVTYTSTLLKEPTSKWVKKRADKNCLSANPEDCIVWCLVEEDRDYYEYYTLIDTSVNKQFEIKNFSSQKNLNIEKLREWKEVLCESDLTEDIYYELQDALIDLNYMLTSDGKDYPMFNSKMKEALANFQRDKKLPIGGLTLESLTLLKVVD